MNFTREVKFVKAFDRRHDESGKNYGVHGLHIWFNLRCTDTGEGLTFSIATNWQLPHVQAETDARPGPDFSPWLFHKPQPFGVDIHRKTGSGYEQPDCNITGGKCFSDGSAMLGEDFFNTLVEGGDEALWARMEQQYIDWSGN